MRVGTWTIFILLMPLAASIGQENERVPEEHVYASPDGLDLKAFVIAPENKPKETSRAVAVVFHGGGWTIGSAEWGLGRARHFASLGMVGISAQYRLSNEKDITPLDAMADARAVIRWIRMNADKLGIDKSRVAAYGWSAGGHLVACAAAIQDPTEKHLESAVPDAMILVSPALDTANNSYYERLLLGRAPAKASSPDHHVKPGLPPTLILQGRTDTVTPTPGVAAYAKLMKEAGNRCELIIYEGVGHLFTPSSEPDDDWPNPDPEVRAKAYAAADGFLKSLGFLD